MIELSMFLVVIGFISLAPIAAGSAAGPVGTAIGLGISVATSLISPLKSLLGKGQTREANATAAQLTNAIESAMDLNRFAFHSGTINIEQFRDNYQRLWGALVNAANQVGSVDPEYGRRMLADRDYGGKFAQVWKFQFFDGPMEERKLMHLDSGGYVKPEFQWAWPDKAKFLETPPIEGFEAALLEQQVESPKARGSATSSVATLGLVGAAALILRRFL